jgi:adenylate kinase
LANKKIFLIIGAPGSGKTTDAELINEKYPDKIAHYSTGELLRQEVTSGSDRGKTIDGFIANGNLVPLAIVIETVVGAIKNAKQNVVLIDGFPRSEEQMMALDSYLADEKTLELTSVIEVTVSEQTAKDRVLGRARGADDNEEVFNNRMKVYTDPLKVIQDFYTSKSLLKKVDGEGSIEEIVGVIDTFIQSKI